MKLSLYTVLLLLLFAPAILAQKNYSQIENRDNYQTAIELFEKEKYSSAQRYFEKYIQRNQHNPSLQVVNAEYYAALCALRLYNNDAEYRVVRFIDEYPESHHVNNIKLEAGEYFYSRKNYRQAIDWLLQVEQSLLKGETKAEVQFKLAYSYFETDDLENARINFFKVKDKDTKYASPATYYYGHINYSQENYETALTNFLELTHDESFGPIVPYYITQIYYLQKRYDQVIEYAPGLMDNIIPKRKAEVARIIGESYFRRNNFRQAIEYLEIYAEESGTTSAGDKYQLAYCYYQLGNYPKAVALFEQFTNSNNELAQNALYHLAHSYLLMEERDKARTAFSGAANLEFDNAIREDALFNYAKLTYELSYSPFNEAIRAFNKYLRLFPDSKKKNEVYNYLVMAYLNTKNYRLALSSIEKIEDRDEQMNKAYQQITFFRALELYNNLQFQEAIALLEKSLEYSRYNRIISARTHYWMGESYYRLGEYVKATEMLQEFILMSGAFQLNEYQLAHYTLGYAYFNQKKYTEAATWFRKYVAFEDNSNTKTVTDANIRIGDCLFVNIQYWPALEYYEKAANKGDYDVDYALFQQGFVYGLVQRPQKKIELMRRILSEHPESSYADDALFELGKAYTAQQNNTQAGQYYNELINSYPNSSYKKKSLVQLGLIYYNTDRNDQALEMYKSVVENYPGTPEAKDALLGIKNIYLDMNDVDRYFDYVKEQGNYVTISTAEQDSLTYKAAENLYMAGNCDRAVQQMTGYLEKYPQGVFTTNAWFYKGDCHYQNEQYEEALKAFNKVIEEPKNMFTEAALLGASRINFANEEYQVALENYTELEKVTELKGNLIEARLGQMRCHYLLAQYEKAIAAANELLLTEKISSEMEREARFQIATSYRKIGREDDALDEYRLVAQEVTSEEGAESKYWAAQLLFNKEELEKAEEVIFEFIDMNTPHQYWMARSFILLAKTYMEREDYFQAGHTLQSILDYYEIKDDGIIDEARQLKQTIEQLEGEENKSPELQDIEINIDEDSTNE